MNIAIWGAGKFGHFIKEQLDKREDVTFAGFIDSKIQGSQNGIKIIAPSQIKDHKIDLILVAVVNFASVLKQLPSGEIDKAGVIRGYVYKLNKKLSGNLLEDSNILWLKNIESDRPFMDHLETNIMDSCNLNCKGCSHFSNLFTQDDHIPFEQFCNDLEKIAEHAWINRLYLLGGEPLLNKQLPNYISFARELLPLTEIEIVTNGILIPKQSENFFKCCRENDVFISISGYKPMLRMKEDIIKTLEKNEINHEFRMDVLSFGKNIDLQGEANPQNAFRACREKDCHFFRNGRLYKCPFEALGNKLFTQFDIDICFQGGIDIYDPDLNWDEAITKLDNEPISCCRYCGEEERIEWAIENHPQLEDWIIRK